MEDKTLELKPILVNIIEDKYHDNIDDWLFYAKPNEKKGLYILKKVVKYEGKRVFKSKYISYNNIENEADELKSLTLEEAYRRYRTKKSMSSSYDDAYSGIVDDKIKYNSILSIVNFKNVNYSEYIKTEYHPFIQNWLIIEKTEIYKDFVLQFLRSFASTYLSNRKFVTVKEEYYKDFKPSERYSCKSINPNLAISKPKDLTIEEIKKRMGLDKKENIDKSVLLNKNNTPGLTKPSNIQYGAKNILNSLNLGTVVSSYMDSYKGGGNKYNFALHREKYPQSMVNGLMPDSYIINNLKDKISITNSLRSSVDKILNIQDKRDSIILPIPSRLSKKLSRIRIVDSK